MVADNDNMVPFGPKPRCPHCGSTDVNETSTTLPSSAVFFICNACGRVDRSDLFQARPVARELAEAVDVTPQASSVQVMFCHNPNCLEAARRPVRRGRAAVRPVRSP
jgi:hypothetical protein